MAQQFFIRRGDQEQGPFTPEQIKELAASGKLVASDLVRTAEKAEWRQAGTIKGLFGADRPATSLSPPPPPHAPQTSPASSPAAPPLPTTTAHVASTVQSGLTDVLTTAMQAKDLAAAHARKAQINQMTLPKAFLALGKEVFESGLFREQFSDLFQRITATNDEIAKVAATDKERPQATDLKGKLQAGAAHLLAQGQGAKLGMRRDSLLRDLGRKAFETHGPTAGSEAVVAEITQANAEIGRLDQEIGRLSATNSAKKNKYWIAGVVGGGAVMFMLCCGCFGLIGNMLDGAGGVSKEYYPFQPGSKRQMVSRFNVTSTHSIQSRREVTHESGGVIRTRTINQFVTPSTGVNLPIPAPSEERYRERNGFIEIGQSDTRNGTFFYEPVIRLGAAVGDTWKSDLGNTYTVLPFETKEIEGKSIQCAVIEQIVFAPNSKVVLTKVKTAYGRGLGPVSVLVLAPDSTGDLQVKRTEQLMPTLKE